MKTYTFEATDALGIDQIEDAIGSMAQASTLIRDENQEPVNVVVASLSEGDIADAVAREMTRKSQEKDLRDRFQSFTNILIAIAKQNGGKLRITQSELDETQGWGLGIGPKDNVMVIEVKSPAGLIHLQ